MSTVQDPVPAQVQVQFETTPNPATMKFNLSVQILSQGLDFPTAQDAESSPLASKLFGFPWTSGVYVGPNFVSVTKQDWVEWDILAEPLAGLIREHLEAGLPIHIEREVISGSNAEDSLDSPIVKEIKIILNRDIRPAVAMDGGDIVFAKYEDQILYIHMRGSCAGCPSSTATLKEGIEVRFKELLPEIKEVVAI